MSIDLNIPVITVFLQGILSFFSPCVLPKIPLYMGYLSGGTVGKDAEGRLVFLRSKVLLHTLFFILGIGFSFLILGLGMTALGSFFNDRRMLFARIGGMLIILFGLYQLGAFGSSKVLEREYRLPLHMEKWAMTPFTALVMGFVFSFAWTPCVGPTLSSVLLMAASAKTRGTGLWLILVYTVGFCLPFLAVGFFTTTLLDWFKKHRGVVRYTAILGGILMILMGVLMLTGKMNEVTGYLSRVSAPAAEESSEESADSSVEESSAVEESSTEEESSAEEASAQVFPAIDFTLTDQFGNVHTLSDYKGSVVFLNFWATWCPPCRAEMPDIQALYEKYQNEEVVILGVAAPEVGGEGTAQEIAAFLEENGYTYPVVMDEGGLMQNAYQITAFPTTFMIDIHGNIYGYVPGMMSAYIMQNVIDQTIESIQ